MKINNIEVKGDKFAYDGCHKIYIIEDDEDLKKANELEYLIKNIEDLEDIYNESCELRFIRNWKLNILYAPQFEKATFE